MPKCQATKRWWSRMSSTAAWSNKRYLRWRLQLPIYHVRFFPSIIIKKIRSLLSSLPSSHLFRIDQDILLKFQSMNDTNVTIDMIPPSPKLSHNDFVQRWELIWIGIMQNKSRKREENSNTACRCEGQARRSMESSILILAIMDVGEDQIAYLQLGADVLQFRFLKKMTKWVCKLHALPYSKCGRYQEDHYSNKMSINMKNA